MIDITYFKKSIITWIAGKVSESITEVIWANQPGPAPKTPYITLNLMFRKTVGGDSISGVDEETERAVINGTREVMLSIQAFGSGAFQEISNLEDEFRKESLFGNALFDLGIAYIDSTGVKDITALFGSYREERANMDVRLRIPASFEEERTTEDLGVMEAVTIETEMDGIEETIEVGTIYVPPEPPPEEP